MAICSRCGKEFNLSTARRMIGRIYGAGMYDDTFEDGDVCGDCADIEIGSDIAEYEDMRPWIDSDD